MNTHRHSTEKVYALEPFYGGSHRKFLENLASQLPLTVQVLPMSPHHWKWRMHGSALYYTDLFAEENFTPGIIFASDFVNLAGLKGLLPNSQQWTWLLYFHENQLTYPVRNPKERDLTYAHMNIQSALAAESVYFNSRFHQTEFLAAIPKFYSRFIDYKPERVPERINGKSKVIPLGLDLQKFDALSMRNTSKDPGCILWNLIKFVFI